MTVSAVILTHNNETTISAVLEGLKWCNERILVDDYSTDETVKRAREYKVKVILRHLVNDFAAQRNAGLTEAKGDWVLFVDSDEMVTSKLKQEILKCIQDDKFVGYYVSRKDFLFGRELRYGETSRVKLLRLAKRNCGTWSRRIHEVWNVKSPVGTLATPLFHYPHTDVAQFLSVVNRYTSINAEVFYEEGKRVSWWQIAVYPVAKFFQNYFLRLGFLDGTAGFICAMMMSFHSFLTRGKLWELQEKQKRSL